MWGNPHSPLASHLILPPCGVNLSCQSFFLIRTVTLLRNMPVRLRKIICDYLNNSSLIPYLFLLGNNLKNPYKQGIFRTKCAISIEHFAHFMQHLQSVYILQSIVKVILSFFHLEYKY